MAGSLKRQNSFPLPKPERQKSPTNLLRFSYLEEQPIEVSAILRRLPYLTRKVPDRLFHPPRNSGCSKSSNENAISLPPTLTASNTPEATDGESPTRSLAPDVNKKEPVRTSCGCHKHQLRNPTRCFSQTCRCKNCVRRRTAITTDVSSWSTSTNSNSNSNSTKAAVSDFEGKRETCTNSEVIEPLPRNDFWTNTELVAAFAPMILDPTLSTASESSLSTSSPTAGQYTTTLAIRKKVKAVRFVDGLKDNEHMQAKCSKIIEYPKNSEELQELIQELKETDTLGLAIEHLRPPILSKIAFSLNEDIALPLVDDIAPDMRQKANDSSEGIPPDELESYKHSLLRFLDGKTNQRYLCRDCEAFHAIPVKRCNEKTLKSEYDCATRYIIGHNNREDRIFDKPFRFSQIQFAMKLFRHGLNYNERLKPLTHATVSVYIRLSYIRTSEVYPVPDRLLNRIQHWYHTSPDIEKPLSKAELLVFCTLESRNQSRITNLCRHLMFRHWQERKYGHVLWDFENQENNPNVRRCDECALEYRCDWYEAGGYSSGLVLTIWRDFGQCLTPFDPRWRAHFEEYEHPEYVAKFSRYLGASGFAASSSAKQEPRWHEDMEPAASNWLVGEIQKKFEAKGGFDLQGCVQRMKECEMMKEGPFECLPRTRKEFFRQMSTREYLQLLEMPLVGRPSNQSGRHK